MIKISKLFIPYIVILVMIGFNKGFAISFLWVFIHELFHVLCAKAMGIKNIKIKIMPIGTSLYSEELNDLTPKQDLIISLAGPISNIIIAGIIFIISFYYSNYFIALSVKINLTLGFFNLVPALPLDGARILRDILSMKTIYKRANKITITCSTFMGLFMLICFIFLCFLNKVNLSLGLLSLFIIFVSYKEKERIVYIIMGDIVRKRVRFLRNKYIENKSLSVHYKSELIQLLGIIDKNKYNVFTVLDDEMKVIKVIYEQEIIEALKTFGNITVEEYLDNL